MVTFKKRLLCLITFSRDMSSVKILRISQLSPGNCSGLQALWTKTWAMPGRISSVTFNSWQISWAHTTHLLFSPRFGQATHGSAIKPQIFSEFSHWKTSHTKQNKLTLNLLKPKLWPFFPPKYHPSRLKIVRDLIYFGENSVEAPAGNSGLLFSRLNLTPLLGQKWPTACWILYT